MARHFSEGRKKKEGFFSRNVCNFLFGEDGDRKVAILHRFINIYLGKQTEVEDLFP